MNDTPGLTIEFVDGQTRRYLFSEICHWQWVIGDDGEIDDCPQPTMLVVYHGNDAQTEFPGFQVRSIHIQLRTGKTSK